MLSLGNDIINVSSIIKDQLLPLQKTYSCLVQFFGITIYPGLMVKFYETNYILLIIYKCIDDMKLANNVEHHYYINILVHFYCLLYKGLNKYKDLESK